MSAHTHGPWRVAHGDWSEAGNARYELSGIRECCAADARLIEAAPDLLAVLRITAGNIRSLGPAGALAQVHAPYQEWLAAVDAVIAQATAPEARP